MFLVALAIGSVITGVILSIIKKVPQDDGSNPDMVNPLDIVAGTENQPKGSSSIKEGDLQLENF